MASNNTAFTNGLPNGWRFDRLKDVVSLRDKKTDEESETKDYLELEDLESGTGRLLNRRNSLGVGSAVTLFKKGDVLFGKLRPYLEKYYEADFDGKCTGEILAFRPERIRSRFLFYCVGAHWFVERCSALAYGAKMPRVNWPTQLAQFDMPLPPLPEQEWIVRYLDASCAATDAAVAAKRCQRNVLEEMRTSVALAAVTRGVDEDAKFQSSGEAWIGDVPATWAIRRIKDIAELRSGNGITSEEISPIQTEEFPYPVFGGNGLRGYFSSYTHEGHYVLVGRQGALCGNINYASGRFWASEHAVVVSPRRKTSVLWLGEVLRAMNLNQYSNAAAQPGLSVDRIKFLKLPVPSHDQQITLERYLESAFKRIDNIAGVLDRQIQVLLQYRKSLIHECVTGQRRVPDRGGKVLVHG